MATIIKMKDLLKKEGMELGKIYTDKDRPPFKVNEQSYSSKEAKMVVDKNGNPIEDYEYNEQKKESIAEDRMDEKRDMGL